MTRPRFSFRPNLRDEEHRRAWAALQAVPEGRRNAFLVRAILQSAREDDLEDCLRRVLREELRTLPPRPEGAQDAAIPQEMLGFLSDLLKDG